MSEAHTTRAHARLAPSAAHRWIECPGSVRLSEGIPDTTSSFAAEGTAAHELAAFVLMSAPSAGPEDHAGRYVDIKFATIVDTPEDTDDENRFFEITDEMVDAVSMYVDHVRSVVDTPDVIDIETRLDMTHIHPEIYGTGDATVYDQTAHHLHVIDLKYGKGLAVDADENPQLLLYAAGAARRHHNMAIEKLTVHIVQPRAPHAKGPIRSYEIDLLALFEFEDDLAKAAKRTEDPNAPLAAGEWCKFCKVQPICDTARAKRIAAAAEEFGEVGDAIVLTPPDKLAPDRLGAILKEADQIGNYVKAVQEFAHAQAMAGNVPSGFKLVEKRAVRKWKDEQAVADALPFLDIDPEVAFTEPKLKSPAQLERHFPGKNAKARQEAMADLVVKQSSGTNLVAAEDPRPAVAVGAGADFDVVEV